MADAQINDLAPVLQKIYAQWLQACATFDFKARAIVTYRDAVSQNAAAAAGRSKATAGNSPHNVEDSQGNPASLAFDFGVFDEGTYVMNGQDPRYAQLGALGKSLGLEWGGDWTLEKDGCEPDYDHLQIPHWRDVAATL